MKKYLAVALMALTGLVGVSALTACGDPNTVVYEVDDDEYERYEYDD